MNFIDHFRLNGISSMSLKVQFDLDCKSSAEFMSCIYEKEIRINQIKLSFRGMFQTLMH